MDNIVISNFKGTIPKVSSKLLPENYATTATNCELTSGKIKALTGLISSVNIGTTNWRTIYRFGTDWLYWEEDVDVVRAMVNTTTDKERTFYTGDGYPKQTDIDLMPTSGNPSSTSDYRRLGIAAPTTAPTLTINGTGDGEVVETISYVYTYVVQWADGTEEESAPSDATAVTDIEGGQYVSLSNFTIPSLVSTGNDIGYFRIYRLEIGDLTEEYQLLNGREDSPTASTTDTYDASTTTVYDCNSSQDGLIAPTGILIETTDWTPPPDTLKGLKQFQNGILVGFKGNELWFSEPYVPYAWPESYVLTFSHNIIAIGVHNESIIVATEAYPNIVTGSDPSVMTQQILPYNQPCLSKKGLVSTRLGVIYPSPDGYFLVNNTTGEVITKSTYSKSQWNALNPATLITVYHDDKLLGYFESTSKTIIFYFTEDNDIVKITHNDYIIV